MNTLLDIEKWARKEHFKFFKQFEEPFFGVCVDVECTESYAKCKSQGVSFFLFYLHKCLVAANRVESFRYRIKDDSVIIYDKVFASPTINRNDGTFGFAYFDYYEEFQVFSTEAKKEIERVQNSQGLFPAVSGENVIHCSTLPWINFKSVSHARSFTFKDSCPKVTFGKITEYNSVLTMPVSIHVHHALMDGIHVGQFIGEFQNLMH